MGDYFRISRTHSYSLLFALPLLLLYELGAVLIADGRSGLRNGADVLLRTLLAGGGVTGTLALTAVLVLGSAVLVARERRRKPVPLRGGVFAGMMVESALYALLFGLVVGVLTQWLVGSLVPAAAQASPMERLPLLDALVLSLGAGIYEELVFRVLLVGALLAVFRAAGLTRGQAGVPAALLAALLFSAFHYVGPYAYPFEVGSFTFRFLAGLAFSILFLTRGFGIAAWTHALYDVFLVLARAG